MTNKKTVLIAGIGVAGLAAARLLKNDGWTVTLIERAASIRMGGQPVDVRGPALEVMAQLGQAEALQAARTQMRGMSIVDENGVEMERNTEWTLGTGQLESSDVEILRDDLLAMLRAGEHGFEEIYNESVKTLDQNGDSVNVTFERSAPRRFDLVIGADGLNSRVRKLAFGPREKYLRHLGKYLSVFSGPNILDLDFWSVWYRSEDLNYLCFPVRNNSAMRTGFWFNDEAADRASLPIDAQKQLTAVRLQSLGGQVPRLIEMMKAADDFYFSPIAQIQMDHYAKGRIVLLGDACFCASPFSGQGTSLALIGAHVLAKELRQADGYQSAFARYETRMRPFVALNQTIVNLDRADPNYIVAFDKIKMAITL